ncbi:hypothetical protein BpHYR1_032459 [Brachionus plicatilis]|uniref:Uncharacterized protein n=1 Tax=Brachionus plicatilis TaxID=10195 RepID=A0A3M7SUG8_BRAPC|nr:hypothetical protein BpHYR1_032459 [Brachionus plicatilis]
MHYFLKIFPNAAFILKEHKLTKNIFCFSFKKLKFLLGYENCFQILNRFSEFKSQIYGFRMHSINIYCNLKLNKISYFLKFSLSRNFRSIESLFGKRGPESALLFKE